MSDNLEPGTQVTQDPNAAPAVTLAPADTGTWKQHLSNDLRNSPIAQKFADTYEGLNESFKSHSSLEQLLGHEKVPIPKGEGDTEGWARFSKAMGIPDVAEGYGLADPELPEGFEGLKGEMVKDKSQFAEMCHGFKLTPNQTKGLWDAHVKSQVEDYSNFQEETKQIMAKTVNQLRGEWGDAYDGNIHLGQMVINKFSGGNKELENFLTTSLSKDPRGVKFLAQVGKHFAENKIGEFSATRFSLAPEQAMAEIEKISRDPKHPYTNPNAGRAEHDQAVNYVNRLYKIANKQPV